MMSCQRDWLVTVFNGTTRDSSEGIHLKTRTEEVGLRQAAAERGQGTCGWPTNQELPKHSR
jgi:hypothetical protein